MERLSIARAAGADGTLLGLPMWQPMTEEMALRFYGEVSASFPDLAVMVYANERAFRFPFATSPQFWHDLVVAAPTATSAKFSRPATFAQLREASGGRVHFLPNDSRVREFAEIAPEAVTACWATAASMGPEPCLRLIAAINRGDAETVATIDKEIAECNEPLHAVMADATLFASYNIQIEKIRINAAGYCDAGPIRPPYDVIPDEIRAQAVECGQRWRALRARLAS
jgi:dihydrodipicolinate synthase/N-acetylneuraminate lyase